MKKFWQSKPSGESDWTTIDAWGLSVPIQTRWAEVSGDPIVRADEDARLDVRREPDGPMIDGARVRELRERFGVGASVSLVRVHGRAAIRTDVAKQGATVLTYEIAGEPIASEDDVRFPVWRVVYALNGAPHDMIDGIVSRLEGGDPTWHTQVSVHQTDDHGHLSFGPIPVPASWRLVGDDGELVELPPADGNVREMNLAGGWVFLVDANDKSGQLIFRPQWIGVDFEQAYESFVRERRDRIACATGRDVVVDESRVARARFVAGPVGVMRWRDEGDSVVQAGAYLIWQDVLGYQWELGYVVPSCASAQLDALVAASLAE